MEYWTCITFCAWLCTWATGLEDTQISLSDFESLIYEQENLDGVCTSNTSTELPSSQVRTDQLIQLNLVNFNPNNNCFTKIWQTSFHFSETQFINWKIDVLFIVIVILKKLTYWDAPFLYTLSLIRSMKS